MKATLLFFMLCVLPFHLHAQGSTNYTTVTTKSSDVKVPGDWEKLNTMDDSGQTYLKNKDGIVIAIAQNPKVAYSFFKSNKSDFENVKLFHDWDSDYRKENKFPTAKLKENAKLQYVIWKFNDGKADNVFLFGSTKDSFINLLVYTNSWSEDEKIAFLENIYKLNKQ